MQFLLVILSLISASHTFAAQPSLFAFEEARFENVTPFKKWLGMLERYPEHVGQMEVSCSAQTPCAKYRWEAEIKTAKGAPILKQLASVNRFINQSPYVVDEINWGIEDYWETPPEFFIKNGDCEDYAIAKYKTLKRLGVSPESMRVVILSDTNLGVMHAVLAVAYRGKHYILDNQIEEVLPDARIKHYQPIYSINEFAWWRHLPKVVEETH